MPLKQTSQASHYRASGRLVTWEAEGGSIRNLILNGFFNFLCDPTLREVLPPLAHSTLDEGARFQGDMWALGSGNMSLRQFQHL